MDKQIRVAIVCTSLNQIGGKNVHFKNMYKNLNNEKTAMTIILSSSIEKEHRAYLLQEGVNQKDIIFIPRFKKWIVIPFIVDLVKIFKSRGINIAHTFQIQSDILGGIAARIAGLDCVISQQESKALEETLPALKRLFYRSFNACIMNSFRKTVVVSEGLKKELVAEKFRPEEKIEVIHLGINIPDEYKKREFSFVSLKEKKPVIGTLARLNKEKGIDRFIEAIPYILKKIPQARFLIVGKGDEKINLERQARNLGLDSKVEFREASWKESIFKVFETMDIFVMSSLREGCPIALLEAMATSRPIVASRIEGISDLVEDGKSGLMVDTSNPYLFAEKVIYLCEHPDVAVSMGREAQKKVTDNFTLEREMDSFARLYQDVLTKN